MPIAKDTKRKFMIIAVMATEKTPDMEDIARMTGIPVSSIKRNIGQIRKEYAMDIKYVTTGVGKGRTGFYYINHWGILDREEFKIRYPQLINQE